MSRLDAELDALLCERDDRFPGPAALHAHLIRAESFARQQDQKRQREALLSGLPPVRRVWKKADAGAERLAEVLRDHGLHLIGEGALRSVYGDENGLVYKIGPAHSVREHRREYAAARWLDAHHPGLVVPVRWLSPGERGNGDGPRRKDALPVEPRSRPQL